MPELVASKASYGVIWSYKVNIGYVLLAARKQNADDDAMILTRSAQTFRKETFKLEYKFSRLTRWLTIHIGTVIWELNLHIRIKVWNFVHTFMGPYYLIKSMEALWEINSSAESNIAALDTRIGHISVNARSIFIILVPSIRVSRVGSPSVRYFVAISKVLTKLHRI